MTAKRGGWRRRAYLSSVVGSVAGLAGCPGGTSTSTETETTTQTDREQTPAADEQTATETSTDPTTDVITFDGGGAAAFADALDEVRDRPGATLTLAPGSYRFDASAAPNYEYPREDHRVHFDGTGLADVTVTGPAPDAEGTAEIVLEDPTRGFLSFANPAGATAADRPTGPTIRDLTVRHDPLPFTQGRIDSLSGDRREISLTLDDGFPGVDEPPFAGHDPFLVSANVFTADGTRVGPVTEDARSNFKRFASVEQTGDRRATLRLAEGVEPGGLAERRKLAVLPRHRNATLFLHNDLTEPTYERVTVHSTSNFTFEFNACDRPVVRDCTVEPADGALVATNADGLHCNNCPRGPVVEGCTFRRTSDDAVVVDAELMAVTDLVDERTVRVSADFGTRVGEGDRLTHATPALERTGELPPVAAVDQRGGGVTTEAVNPELVQFADPIDDRLGVGDALFGPRMRNRGTVVRDTTVESTRARYVRFGGVHDGLVENNSFAGTNSDGVEIEAAGDVRAGYSDLKGWSADVVVRGNEILDTGLVGVPSGIPRAIFVGVDGGEGPAPNASTTGRAHRNVRVVDNVVRTTGGHAIEVADTAGVTLAGNRIETFGVLSDIDVARYGLGIRHVSDVTVRDNTVTIDDTDAGFGWTHESDVADVGGNSFVVTGTKRGTDLVDLSE